MTLFSREATAVAQNGAVTACNVRNLADAPHSHFVKGISTPLTMKVRVVTVVPASWPVPERRLRLMLSGLPRLTMFNIMGEMKGNCEIRKVGIRGSIVETP